MMPVPRSLAVLSAVVAALGPAAAAPQFGFLGNIFGGFLGNRGPTSQAAPAFGAANTGV